MTLGSTTLMTFPSSSSLRFPNLSIRGRSASISAFLMILFVILLMRDLEPFVIVPSSLASARFSTFRKYRVISSDLGMVFGCFTNLPPSPRIRLDSLLLFLTISTDSAGFDTGCSEGFSTESSAISGSLLADKNELNVVENPFRWGHAVLFHQGFHGIRKLLLGTLSGLAETLDFHLRFQIFILNLADSEFLFSRDFLSELLHFCLGFLNDFQNFCFNCFHFAFNCHVLSLLKIGLCL